jgi:hypothetical protein
LLVALSWSQIPFKAIIKDETAASAQNVYLANQDVTAVAHALDPSYLIFRTELTAMNEGAPL